MADLNDREFDSLDHDVKELIALLTAIIKTEKNKQKKKETPNI